MIKKKYNNQMYSWNKKLFLLTFMFCFFVFSLQPSSVSNRKVKKNNKQIPNLMGKSLLVAKRQLKDLGFRNIKIKYMKTTKIRLDGKVKNTFPPIGKHLSLKQEITLNVYTIKAAIPDVYGITLSKAVHKIKDAGLQFVISYIPANSAAQRDRIRDTNPPRRKLVRPNTMVTLYVYLTHIMPDVYGMDKGAAIKKLGDTGLSFILSYVPSSIHNQREKVRDTIPPRGAQPVNKYPKVNIYLSPAVPDVYGMLKNDAVRRLRDAGFSFILTYVPSNNSSQRDRVRDTIPSRGKQPTGNNITLKIYLAASVPDVYGMIKDTAVKRLSDEGFTFEISYVNTSNISLNNKVRDTVPPRNAQPLTQLVRINIYRYH